MKEITRFAPSPTGYLHIGGARTALFNYLLAKNTGGEFLLRVEDTDYGRNVKEATQAILDGMSWLGMKPDRDVVYQSLRIADHKKYIKELITKGAAYFCTCTKEELDALRSAGDSEAYHYNRTCINKHNTEGAVRLKVNPGINIVWEDVVKGKISVNTDELDDFIIARSDGTPTYNLAVVCDDHDMGITTVIRGDDHVNNTPKQLLIYEALGWNPPRFGHVPMIYGDDKKKLSKRHGATSVIDYKSLGYTPDAMINFLARLGWSNGNQEIFTRDELFRMFSVDKLSLSPAVFDFKKLGWVNQQHLNRMPEEECIKVISDGVSAINTIHVKPLKGLLVKRCQTFKDMDDMISRVVSPVQAAVSEAAKKAGEIVADSPLLANIIMSDNFNSGIKDLSEGSGLDVKDIYTAINTAVYGSPSAPDTGLLCKFVGPENLKHRLRMLRSET